MALQIASEFSWALVFNLASNQRRDSPSSWPSWVPDWRYPGFKDLAEIDPMKISTQDFKNDKQHRRFFCVAVTEALSLFRQRTGIWGFAFDQLKEKPASLEELQHIIDRLSPVDEEAESLWPVPSWQHMEDLKKRWIARCRDPAPWGPIEPDSCDDFLRRAAALPPVEESFMTTEHESFNHSLHALVKVAWNLEQRRSLEWRILLRVFLPTESTVVIY
ncbi:hypothetical protein PG987_007308 [Apiospora arundinis]